MGRVFDIRKKRFLEAGELSETLKRIASQGPRSARAPGVFDVRTGTFLSDQQVIQRRITQLVQKGGDELRNLNPAEKVQLKELKETTAKIPKLTRVTTLSATVAGVPITRKDLSEAQKGKILDSNVLELERELKALEDEKTSLLEQEKTIARKDITAASKFNLDVKKFNDKIKFFNQKTESIKLEVQDFNRELQRKAASGEITLIGAEKISRVPTTAQELLTSGIAGEVQARRPIVGVQSIPDIGAAITKRTRETLLGFGELGAGLAATSIKGFQTLGVPTKPDPELVKRLGRAAGITAGAAIALPEAVLQQAVSQTIGLAEEVTGKITRRPTEPLKFELTGVPGEIVRGAKGVPFLGALIGAEEAVTDRGVFLTRPALAEFASAVTFLALPAVRAPKVKKAVKVPVPKKVPKKAPITKAPPSVLEKLIARERIQLLGEKPVVAFPERIGAVPEVFKRFRQAEEVLLEKATKPIAKRAVIGTLARLEKQLAVEKALKPFTTEIQFQRQIIPSLVRQVGRVSKAEIALKTAPVRKALVKVERKVGRKFSKFEREILAAREDVLFTLVKEPKIKIQETLFRLKREARFVTPLVKETIAIPGVVGRRIKKPLVSLGEELQFGLITEPTIKAQEALFRARTGFAREFQLE